MLKRVVQICIAVFLVISFSACGGGKAPANATLTFDRSSISMTDTTSTSTTSTEFLNIVVKDENGIPLNDVDLVISFIFANPSSLNVVQLYEGGNPRTSPMTVKTDTNGAYRLQFTFQHGNSAAYKGNFVAVSGTLTGTSELEVKATATTS